MEFEDINEYYLRNPPSITLDDWGVKHLVEVPLPADYELERCKCGILHPVESDTWYHKAMILTQDGKEVAVYRACKECREVLVRKIKVM